MTDAIDIGIAGIRNEMERMQVLTEDERTALVEELAEVMMGLDLEVGFMNWNFNDMATACLPIIDRLLAAHDLDALLDSVPGMRVSSFPNTAHGDGNYHAGTYVKRDGYWVTEYWGTGPTRTAAIAAAVAKAKEQGNE